MILLRLASCKKNSRFGFTLIELLVVMSIVSLLSSIVFTSLSASRDKARIARGQGFSASLSHARTDDAVVTYDFNDGSGTVVYDTSGNGKDGTINVATLWTTDRPGISGYALAFNGVSDYFVSPTVVMNGSDESVSIWIKTTSIGIILGNVYSRRLFYSQWLFVDSGNVYNYINLNQTINDGKWHNIAYSLIGTSVTVYVDGSVAATAVLSNPMTPSYSGVWNLGGNLCSGNCNNFWNGMADELHVYNRSLSASQFKQIYALGALKRGIALK